MSANEVRYCVVCGVELKEEEEKMEGICFDCIDEIEENTEDEERHGY